MNSWVHVGWERVSRTCLQNSLKIYSVTLISNPFGVFIKTYSHEEKPMMGFEQTFWSNFPIEGIDGDSRVSSWKTKNQTRNQKTHFGHGLMIKTNHFSWIIWEKLVINDTLSREDRNLRVFNRHFKRFEAWNVSLMTHFIFTCYLHVKKATQNLLRSWFLIIRALWFLIISARTILGFVVNVVGISSLQIGIRTKTACLWMITWVFSIIILYTS